MYSPPSICTQDTIKLPETSLHAEVYLNDTQSLNIRFSTVSGKEPGAVTHTCSPHTEEVETGGSGVQCLPRLYSKSEASLSYMKQRSQNTNKSLSKRQREKWLC